MSEQGDVKVKLAALLLVQCMDTSFVLLIGPDDCQWSQLLFAFTMMILHAFWSLTVTGLNIESLMTATAHKTSANISSRHNSFNVKSAGKLSFKFKSNKVQSTHFLVGMSALANWFPIPSLVNVSVKNISIAMA